MAEDFHHSSTKVKKEKKRGIRIKLSMSSYRQDHLPSHFFKKIKAITTSRFKLIHQIKLFIV